MRRSHKFLKNISFNLLSRIWYIVLALVTTPYIVTKLGTDAYGILSITLTLVGYFSLTEIGMGNTLIKYLSEYLASKKENKVEKQESEKSKKLKQELESMGLFSAMKHIKKNYNK